MNTRKTFQLSILALTLLCLGGCATTSTIVGTDFGASKVSQIIKGKTTSNEIVDMFGVPYFKQPEVEGTERWLYYYVTATVHTKTSLFEGIKTTATGYKKILNILINKNKTVENFTLDEGPTPARTATTH